MDTLRWLPLWMVAAAVGTIGLGRMAIQRIRFGRWGWAVGGARELDAAQVVLIGVLSAVLLEAAAASMWPTATRSIAFPGRLGSSHPGAAGALGALGLLCVFVAQLQMGNSWRIGIEEGARPGLVVHGLYSRCRNPIYAGMAAALLGFLLILPNILSLFVLGLAVGAIRSVVLREEAYLRLSYGELFERYAQRVPRFIPRLAARRPSPSRPATP